MGNRHLKLSDQRIVGSLIFGALATALLRLIFVGSPNRPFYLCSFAGSGGITQDDSKLAHELSTTPTQLVAILHYATTRVVPQQSLPEVKISFDVLQSLAPCNFLVFGLGHDSLMWDSLNPRGNTLFLEEDPKWVQTVYQSTPILRAHIVRYPTQLQQADDLLESYKKEEDCWPWPSARLRDKRRCKLALSREMPEEVYEKDWDVIMIDAPKGYYAEAPGRMGAIYSAAVMARGRRNAGVTHVFLHDVNRKVEKRYAAEFLCMKYKVRGVGRLWHFMIPPAANFGDNSNASRNHEFC